jgi:type II secretory pathway pseudopilin PulG
VSIPGPTSPLDNQQQAATRTSGAAIASFVLALLGFCLSVFTGIPAVICGIVALINIGASNGRLRGKGLAIAGIVLPCMQLVLIPFLGILVALLLPAIQAARSTAQRLESQNRMRQTGLAMATYADTYLRFPAAGTDAQGESPPLSWRVHLLPFVEANSLFEKFDKEQAWDSPTNSALVDPTPFVYQNPGGGMRPGETNYLAVTGPETMFPGGKDGIRRGGVRDGLSNTIAVVEANADRAAIWSEPKDWQYDPNDPTQGLGDYRFGGFLVLMADGSVHVIDKDVDARVFSAMCTADGQEAVNLMDAVAP